jgi:hypothetical protein
MQDLKSELLTLFDGKNCKNFSKMVLSRPQISEKVSEISCALNTVHISETIWCIIYDQTPPKCGCGAPRKFNSFNLGYKQFCSSKNGKCIASRQNQSCKISAFWEDNPEIKKEMLKKKEQTTLAIYGVNNVTQSSIVQQHVKDRNLLKYGVEYTFQSSIVQDKVKATNLEKYGVEYPLQSSDIRTKSNDSFIKNNPTVTDKMQPARDAFIKDHGSNPFAVEVIKNKIVHDRLEKYGFKHVLQSHLPTDIIEVLENKDLFEKEIAGLTIGEASIKLGVNETTIARRAKQHNCREMLATVVRSKWEYKMLQLLLSMGLQEHIDFIRGDRTILNGKELDFYFPHINAAIEVGSVYYHSEISSNRGEKYHYDKWYNCNQKNIQLFQYWDFELDKKWDVIASKVKYLFNRITTSIGARTITQISKPTANEERDFLNKNHIQGYSQDRMIALGAYINSTLVAILTLDCKTDYIEITRYCTDINSSYPGLFSKMLKVGLTQIPDSTGKTLISFSDNRHSNGNVYKKSGFSLSKTSPAEYYYTKDYHSIERKRKYTKQKIKNKFNIDITGKTEWQLMQEVGYDRIWDAGKQLWSMVI